MQRPASIRRTLAITIFLVLSAQAARANGADTWPLVKFASGAVWGQSTAIEMSGNDRLIGIAVDGGSVNSVSRGNGSWTLRERAGRHPDGTSLVPGSTGIFLYETGTPAPGAQGWLVHGGFLPVPEFEDRAPVTRLVLAKLSDDPVPMEDVLLLLKSTRATTRRFAVQCLQSEAQLLSPAVEAGLRDLLAQENSPSVLCPLLDLLLIREWPLGGTGVANYVVSQRHSDLNQLAVAYLGKYGTADDRAVLLTAYPNAELEARKRLLTAYAELGLREAEPWWFDALTSLEPGLVEHALEEFCFSELDGVDEVLKTLLQSGSQRVQRSALRGLGSVGTPAAVETIRELVRTGDPGDPLVTLAHRILQYPYRYCRIRPRSNRGLER